MKKARDNDSVETNKLAEKIGNVIFGLIGEIPQSDKKEALDPETRARELISTASLKAAAISGALALPPGPIGIITIIPDLTLIWRLQAQLVSDIAAIFRKSPRLTQETMLYCLFRHFAAQAVRGLIGKVGTKIGVGRASLKAIHQALKKIGIKIAQRVAGRGIARFLPLIGALGVAGYAYYDTGQVGETAYKYFSKDPVG